MKRLITILAVTLSLASCAVVVRETAKGEIIKQRLAISGEPKALAISHGFDVTVDPTMPLDEIEVVTHSDLMESVEIYIDDTTLNIKLKNRELRAETLSVRIPAFDFSNVAISGGADLKWHNCTSQDLAIAASGGADVAITAQSESIELSASGGSDVVLEGESQRLKVSASGGSDVELRGKSQQLYVLASGGADLNAKMLVAEQVEVSASGGADVNVYATNCLTVVASGSADVYYAGNPATKSISSSGAANVEHKGIDD